MHSTSQQCPELPLVLLPSKGSKPALNLVRRTHAPARRHARTPPPTPPRARVYLYSTLLDKIFAAKKLLPTTRNDYIACNKTILLST